MCWNESDALSAYRKIVDTGPRSKRDQFGIWSRFPDAGQADKAAVAASFVT